MSSLWVMTSTITSNCIFSVLSFFFGEILQISSVIRRYLASVSLDQWFAQRLFVWLIRLSKVPPEPLRVVKNERTQVSCRAKGGNCRQRYSRWNRIHRIDIVRKRSMGWRYTHWTQRKKQWNGTGHVLFYGEHNRIRFAANNMYWWWWMRLFVYSVRTIMECSYDQHNWFC